MKKLFNFIFLFCLVFSNQELVAQNLLPDFDIYELNISESETVFSPAVFRLSEDTIELIVVSSQKNNNEAKIARKFKEVDLNKIFNLQKITIENKPPFNILSKELLSSKINSSYQEGPVSLDKKGSKLFFTRSSQKISKSKKLLLDIYESNYANEDFQNPKKVTLFENEISVMHPSIDSQNNIIYFASNIDQENQYDLYYSKISSEGKFETPQKVPNINSPLNEAFPFIYKDILFFASNRQGGVGGFDIYYSKIEQENYQSPVLLPDPINTKYDDFSFSLTDSLKYGFFSSNRQKDSLDISYLISFKPIKGSSDTYKYATFSSSITEQKSVLLNDSINSNSFLYSDSFKTIIVDKPEFGDLDLNSDGTFVYSNKDEKVKLDRFTYKIFDGYRESNPIEVSLLRMETEIYLRSIYYDFGKFNLIKKYKPRLDSIADLLDNDLKINLLISSYTDARGSFKSNKKLSESRSKTIYNYLIKNRGIDKSRLDVKDYGEQHIKGNLYSDYLVEVFKSKSSNEVSKKSEEFSKYKPFIYSKQNFYFLVVGQFNTKKEGLRFIRKLSNRGIESNLIKNNYIEVSESEHQKNRRTDFKIIK
ncbi:OmpA family protein [Flavobacteriaceae bacterium]|nr:OmpA family protein [Flavobacteriaceae bacterium]